MSRGFAVYVSSFSDYTLVYGAFASLPVFLLWIYLSWLVVVSGAVVTASLPYWQGGAWRIERTVGRRYLDAMRVLLMLCHAQQRGESVTLAVLQRETGVALEDLEDILIQLLDARWVERTSGQGWLLAAHPRDIALLEVFHRFIFRTDATLPDASSPGLMELAGHVTSGLKQSLAGSLEDLCVNNQPREESLRP
jgi:membrane protein